MTWTYVCQVLCDPHSPSRFSREEVLSYSWQYVLAVLFCNRDKNRNPIVPRKSEEKPKDTKAALRKMYWKQGYPEHIIKAKVQEFLDRQKAAEIAAMAARQARGQ